MQDNVGRIDFLDAMSALTWQSDMLVYDKRRCLCDQTRGLDSVKFIVDHLYFISCVSRFLREHKIWRTLTLRKGIKYQITS